jgi:hypothetical protein
MSRANRKKESAMAASALKKKNPMEALVERFGEIIDQGAKTMNAGQLRESENSFSEIIDRAVARK